MNGYGNPAYAASLADIGRPYHLSSADGWVLLRDIPDRHERDAAGCYPLFCCANWAALEADFEALREQAVTLTLVADPFGNAYPDSLRRVFDLVIEYKLHFIVDFTREAAPSPHHRYYAQRALRNVRVELSPDPPAHLDEWVGLYSNVVARHRLTGLHAFSPDTFAQQLRVPGLRMFRAVCDGVTVGAHLWYVHDGVAYSHLTAASALGYRLGASYALHWSGILHLASQVRYLDLGGSAGFAGTSNDGLAQFKRGWANSTRWAYLCGRVLDADRYRAITGTNEVSLSCHFPPYRQAN